jgi:hypothetical protein
MENELKSAEEVQHIAGLIAEEFEVNMTGLKEIAERESAYQLFREKLKERVQELIDHDFGQLVWRLYRADVDESKLRDELDQHAPDMAADVICDMIIAREIKKLATRNSFGAGSPDWSFDLN